MKKQSSLAFWGLIVIILPDTLMGQDSNTNYPPGFGPFEGELAFDDAHDERDELIEFLVLRINGWASNKDFDAVDIASMRACITLLTTIIEEYGGGQAITKKTFTKWNSTIESPFDDDKRWGFEAWPEEEKETWRKACRESMARLQAVVEDYW